MIEFPLHKILFEMDNFFALKPPLFHRRDTENAEKTFKDLGGGFFLSTIDIN